MSKNRSRVLSWIVLIVFSFVIFSSSLFIIAHAGHDCTGDDCSVCMELSECHKTLNSFAAPAGGMLQLALVLIIAAVITKTLIKPCYDHITLISLKVELLN